MCHTTKKNERCQLYYTYLVTSVVEGSYSGVCLLVVRGQVQDARVTKRADKHVQ